VAIIIASDCNLTPKTMLTPINTVRVFNGLVPLETCHDCVASAQEYANRVVFECNEMGRAVALGGPGMAMNDVVSSWIRADLWGDDVEVAITGDMKTLLEGGITHAGVGVCRRIDKTMIVVDFH
jgi:hypothetical protein